MRLNNDDDNNDDDMKTQKLVLYSTLKHNVSVLALLALMRVDD